MKVDVVVNSMIQQIDRNLQTQATPVPTFRSGDILRGRVMLSGDGSPQIRLDSGALLNALPSGDVQLFAGATVTLRVTGNMDGQFVMQLLEQEKDDGQAAQTADATAGPLAKLVMNATPQGRAVLQAMEAMRVPMRGDTVRQALEIMNQFPGLEPEKAVFMAANKIPATQAQVDALNSLVKGATTGGELMKLADILTTQALDAEIVQLEGSAGSGDIAAAIIEAPGGQGAQPQASAAGAAEAAGANPQAMPESDGMLQLQSLVFVALGLDAADKYSGIAAALQRHGLTNGAVQLALDGSFEVPGEGDFQSRLNTLVSTLPQDEAAEARSFLAKLASGLKGYIGEVGMAPGAGQPAEPQQGIPRVVKEIMDLFVRLETDNPANSAALQKAASQQRGAVQHIAAEVAQTGAASPTAAQQLNRVDNHVRLLDNISQYAYQQIPVQLNGRNKTVELYVMNKAKGGKKKINPENASILITLDTEHMGRLETLVGVTGKNLRLRFGVEDPGLVAYVDSFTAEIGQAMQQIGYRLSDVRLQVTEAPVTPLTAAASVEQWDGGASTLDIKL